MAFAENQQQGDSSEYADDGTASHDLAAHCLKAGIDAAQWIGETIYVRNKPYKVDEERAAFVQIYLDDVRLRAEGGYLFVEQWTPIPDFGPDQGGTPDVWIVQSRHKMLIVADLKYGQGEKVYAPNNAQGLSYLCGVLHSAELLCDIDHFVFVVCQPRLGHIDEWQCTREELETFRETATRAIQEAGHAMILPANSPDLQLYLNPHEKTCRWCRAKTVCPKLAKYVADEVRADFDTIAAEEPLVPTDPETLSRASIALPLIETWCRAVRAELWSTVAGGGQVIGPDGKPYKIVEGDEGKRQWSDEAAAEAALLGQLPPDKVYKPREIITAPVAGKLLDKVKTRQLWETVFKPLITRKRGKPQLAYGSDSRPPFSGAASSEEFDNEINA